jgi:hypothetical protein
LDSPRPHLIYTYAYFLTIWQTSWHL